MTEEEWRNCDDAGRMLQFLGKRSLSRKLRLFACAIARRIWAQMDEALPELIELSERFADGEASNKELRAARSQLRAMRGYSAVWAANNALHNVLASRADRGADAAFACLFQFRFHCITEGKHLTGDAIQQVSAAAYQDSLHELTDLVREIFGNPFHTAVCDPSRETTNVLALARAIYAERGYDRLPFLADALQDSGCGNVALLDHCRRAGEHVRGCWALDRILGKE